MFEHCSAAAAPHDDGTVVHSVIRHTQLTPLQNYCSSERLIERAPRCLAEDDSAFHTRSPAGRVAFEHCDTATVPHGDGTVVHAVIRHAQPTPQCERDRSPRAGAPRGRLVRGGFRIHVAAPRSALTLPGLQNTSDREIRRYSFV